MLLIRGVAYPCDCELRGVVEKKSTLSGNAAITQLYIRKETADDALLEKLNGSDANRSGLPTGVPEW